VSVMGPSSACSCCMRRVAPCALPHTFIRRAHASACPLMPGASRCFGRAGLADTLRGTRSRPLRASVSHLPAAALAPAGAICSHTRQQPSRGVALAPCEARYSGAGPPRPARRQLQIVTNSHARAAAAARFDRGVLLLPVVLHVSA